MYGSGRLEFFLAAGMALAVAACGGSTVSAAAGGSGGTVATGGAGGVGTGGGAGVSGGGTGGGAGTSDKLDLLFMVDNSSSMADKQEILEAAVPELLKRLITPDCIDSSGTPTGQTAPNCPSGSQPEFSPVRDIHIGVISSSLGGRGGDVCSTDAPPDDDMGQLIPSVRSNVPSYNSTGFLAWDPSGTRNTPSGENNLGNLITNFREMVSATGQSGCGFESQLESWYRFLIDPDPPTHVTKVNNVSTRQDVPDQTLLAERAAFLRADSVVAVVMLTDENDCSIIDHGLGWLVGSTGSGGTFVHLPRATSACDQDPNSPCCRSCKQVESSPPPGCSPLSQDPSCSINGGLYDDLGDALNLRCYDQKQRFGFTLLFPTSRYVNALANTQICTNRDDLTCQKGDTPVPNPLYNVLAGSKATGVRDPSMVLLAGIVGVPWQDIASSSSLSDATELRYLTADQLSQSDFALGGKTRWDLILGDPSSYSPPLDPFMHETPDMRSGKNPITGDAIQPSNTSTPNRINGHEYDIPNRDDLQYACIFPLPQPRDCTNQTQSCDCSPSRLQDAPNNPLCEPTETGTAGTTQYFAKAYPGLRELEVLKKMGENAVVASICPKSLAPPQAGPSYGYAPAMDALIERLKSVLR